MMHNFWRIHTYAFQSRRFAVARDCLGAVTALTFDGGEQSAFAAKSRRRWSHASSPGSLTVLLSPRLARDGELGVKSTRTHVEASGQPEGNASRRLVRS